MRGNGTFILNRQFCFRDIADGLSHTLVVGERCSKLAPSTWVGVVTGGQHGVAPGCRSGQLPAQLGGHARSLLPQLQQFPPGGDQLPRRDGSVTLIVESIEEQTFHALTTRSGGDIVGE